MDEQTEVVVVGGRCGGATLAAHLGAAGRQVVVVDRSEFPSHPQVPSCPVLYPQAMVLLDELGIAESDYAAACVKVQRMTIEFGGWFAAPFRMVTSRGRDYIHSIDRSVFDEVLWKHLAKYPTVSARSGFAVTDLLREDGRVVGVEGKDASGTHRIRAKAVVGADGRFSLVARKAGAKMTEDRPEHQSTVYWADWEGVTPYDGATDPRVHLFTTGRGTDVLFFPLPGGLVTICTHQRADRVQTDGDAEAYYLREIAAHEPVRKRITNARRTTGVIGMKRVANRYYEHGGPGWVLVGDALHHKDPADGQGIYDAFLESKLLAPILVDTLDGKVPWDEAIATYGRRVLEETHPMFLATCERLKNELYSEPPVPVIRTLIRWWMNDAEYQEAFLRFLCRESDPSNWLSRGLMARATVRGLMGDLGLRRGSA